jgi:hypothetical protein
MTTKRTRAPNARSRDRPTPEQFLAVFPPAIQAIAARLRALVTQTIPNVDEAVYPGWRLIGYRRREGRRSRYFCFVAPFPDRVALGFEYGVLLTNDAGLLEGDGTQVRHVTIRRPEDIREQELAALIVEAAIVAATFKRH